MTSKIRVISLCVIRKGDSILVEEGFDSVKGAPFYRPLGGGIEKGETAKAAAVRELREEIEADVTDLKPLGVLENIFTLEGQLRHEIVFVFEGKFADESLYEHVEFTAREGDGEVCPARWRPLSFFDERHPLVPEALKPLLAAE